ncbi:MAG TPA: serine hydrolase domain-containing protein, partial [Chloroflexia bacterium]|nr:serine hydrolase domain-containing protein [Chloroflexia bacterium]
MEIAEPSATGGRLAPVIARLDAYMRQRLAEGFGPGVAVALTDHEGLRHLGSYGLADTGSGRPVTPATLFEIGSIGKSFVATALLQLHDEGKLDLDAPVTRYLPWFTVQSDFAPITIHHLLSHSSGLVAGADTTPSSPYEVWNLRHTATGFAPGTQFWYSNVGYEILGHILAAVDGRPYADALRARVLDPLGMADSEPVITQAMRPRLATGYWYRYDDRPTPAAEPPLPATWVEISAASGSLACTPADLAAYLRMLLNRGVGPRGPLLSPASYARMIAPVVPAYDAYSYAYGLFVGHLPERGGRHIISHAGETIGYHAVMLGDLDAGLGVVLLTNGPEPGMVEAEWILDLFGGATHGTLLPELPGPRPVPTVISNATDYAGEYQGTAGSLTVRADGERLLIDHAGASVPLERWLGGDSFIVAHPALAHAALVFSRTDGVVVEAFHGGDWYTNSRYSGPPSFAYPPEWDAFVGRYRTYSPWMNNFRIVIRKGQLLLQWYGLFRKT